MPVASTKEFESILMYLSVLRYIFKSKSKQGQYDLNKAAENFYRDFLNLAFDYDLINLNDITTNQAAIDLGDSKQRLCIQVTAENGSPKIKDSLRKFNEHGLEKDYDRFIMLILTSKKGYKANFSVTGISFDPSTDIWDVDDLLKRIEKLPLPKKIALSEMLGREMRPLFAQFADPGSIFKAQPAANRPAVTAKKVLDLLEYDADSGDGEAVFAKITKLYSHLSNLSRQARTCLFTIVSRGKEKHNSLQISTTEYDNLLSQLNQRDRVGNFKSLEDAGICYVDDDFIIAGWKLEVGIDFFILAKELLDKDSKIESGFETLIVEADFTLLD